MHPFPDRSIGPGSTDLALPDAVRAVPVDDLLATAEAQNGRSEMFESVLARRRSVREYGPLAAADLVRVLDQVFRLQSFAEADDGAVRRFRPILPAGARHPIVPLVLVEKAAGLEPGLWRMDRMDVASSLLRPALGRLMRHGASWSTPGSSKRPPAVVVLGARFDATLARYPAVPLWSGGMPVLHLARFIWQQLLPAFRPASSELPASSTRDFSRRVV